LLELQTPTSKLKSSCGNSIEKYLKSGSYLTTENKTKKINKTSKNIINLKPNYSIEERIEILNLPSINTTKNKNDNHINHFLQNSKSEKNLNKFNNYNPINTTSNKSFLATNITLFTNNNNFNNTIIDLKNNLNNTNIFINTNFENMANNTLILNTENFENLIKNQNSNKTIYISNSDFSDKAFRNRRNINLKRGEIFKDKHSNFQSSDASRSTININNTSTQTNSASANLSHLFFGDISNTKLSNKISNLGNYNACAGTLNSVTNIPKIFNNNKDSSIKNFYGKPKTYIFDKYTQFLNSSAKNNISSNKIMKKNKGKLTIESLSCEKQYYDL